jgi:uncharacterized protein involved in outer membrane biogenesis
MKKFLVRSLFALLVLAILGVIAAGLFLDAAVKKGVETVGPMLTGVEIKLDAVKLSLFSGSGKVQGLVIGNPKEFKTPSAIQVGTVSLSLSPGSLLSDKIVIKSIEMQAPEITYETDLKNSNLSKILSTMEEASGGGQPAAAKTSPAKKQKKLQVDSFVITGGKIHVSVTQLGGSAATVPLPPIHLADLGKGPEGITPAELATDVLRAISKSAAQAAGGAVTDIEKGGIHLTGDLGKAATNSVEKLKNIGDLFKRK